MRAANVRKVAIYAALFAGVFLGALLAMFGVTWAAAAWSPSGNVAHGGRILLAVIVSLVVLNAMHRERASLHGEHDTQLG